ncbi:site-specific integrase [Oxalicibacterium faecigallinarum]|uniref:Tyr recombinase domain-containing protein n=1 Tax=Oxalicibacterium faecigallinarum TaxID=573741 RepID=A0A8J3ART2_9BURK|nr:site-specific integrase [Oxalicibacterium faecigallinarum]GGI15722.1 hypothetical protein GCM10008066_00320 [Oxalicibacterium faecigallinarum]
MDIQLGRTVKVTIKHLALRGAIYWFVKRVPTSLVKQYGKQSIRLSLKTSDLRIATRKAQAFAEKYEREFQVALGKSDLLPASSATAASRLAADHSLDTFIDHVAEPARVRHAESFKEKREYVYEEAQLEDFLTPIQLATFKLLQSPRHSDIAFLLSDALNLYFQTHKKGNNEAFVAKQTREWNKLIESIGDIPFDQLSRANVRDHMTMLGNQGLKTNTIRRSMNTCRAVAQAAITERESDKKNPFARQNIHSEGDDAKDIKVPTDLELTTIALDLLRTPSSAASLVALIQIETGARVAEIAGLAVTDVFLDDEVPHIYIRRQPWRDLKTIVSERRVPLVGIALEAMKLAIKLPRSGKGLFEQYARRRGNDAASAAINKRVKTYGITSHSFRHASKDRLREIGSDKATRDAIHGHASGDIADNYGKGHSLRLMQSLLERIELPIHIALP